MTSSNSSIFPVQKILTFKKLEQANEHISWKMTKTIIKTAGNHLFPHWTNLLLVAALWENNLIMSRCCCFYCDDALKAGWVSTGFKLLKHVDSYLNFCIFKTNHLLIFIVIRKWLLFCYYGYQHSLSGVFRMNSYAWVCCRIREDPQRSHTSIIFGTKF